MNDPAEPLKAIHAIHVKLTGRDSRYQIYERSLWDFVQAGFTADDMTTVLSFLLRENRRNDYKYCVQLGRLIGDHERFEDLLHEAKAKTRNLKKPPTGKEIALQELRPVVVPHVPNGSGRSIGEVFRSIGDAGIRTSIEP